MNLPRTIRNLSLPALFMATAGALLSGPPGGEPTSTEGNAESEASELSRMLVSGVDRKERDAVWRMQAPGKNAIPVIVLLLKNADPRVCGAALRLSGRLGVAEKPLVPGIAALLLHPDVNIRSEAARSLGRMGPEVGDAAMDLVNAMLDPSLRIQAEAARAVVKQDDFSEAPLIFHLRFPSTAFSARAFELLLDPALNLGPDARNLVDRALVRALRKNGDPLIRRQAALVLRRIGITSDAAFFALLHAVANDESSGVRAAAALALEDLKGDRREISLRQLDEIRHDLDPQVDRAVEAAIHALEEHR